MQAVILAAGQGKRLMPLTADRPKPMVRIAGVPILEHLLNVLPPEVTEVIIVVGYRGEIIRKHFGDSFGGRRLRYVEQPEMKGPGEALLRARPFIDEREPFLVLYADDLYHPEDVAQLVKKSAAKSGAPSLLVKEAAHPERFGVCLVDDDGRLLRIMEKHPNPPTNLANIGVYVLTGDIFSIPPIIMPNGEHNLAEQIGVLAAQRPIYTERARFWHPIGYPEDVVAAEQWLAMPVEERRN